ncbi:MAG: alpha-galactosidase [Lachnospiraceae bacterium]|nr:alpha-galactosidase [Lachnospiraceae bacterium]
MAIIYHEESKSFHLYNRFISYIIEVMPNGMLKNVYYGKRIHDRSDYSYQGNDGFLMHGVCSVDGGLALQHQKQEYPAPGIGDYRESAFLIRQENGSHISRFLYSYHTIYEGKKPLENLPATYVEKKSEATGIDIILYDSLTDTDLVLTYTIYEDLPVITRSARFEQKGEQTIVLEKALSACVDFPDKEYEMVHLSGAWGRERHIKIRKLEEGTQSIDSIRGVSGAEHNPFIALKRPHTTEFTGEVYGFSFVYSGNFLAKVEVTPHEITRVILGIHPYNFAWPLKKGDSFQTPEVVMVYSEEGLNGMSRVFHELYATRLARGTWRDKERPILINNWEATYFNFNEEKILSIAQKAKSVGIELFVLDDGWYGERNIDDRSLGDWYPNPEKLPHGVSGLSEKIEAMGLKFGIWIEPEMVNKNSDLYRAHPDWLISTPERYESMCRTQHILDYSRKEVVDYIFGLLDKLISESKISYVKWDMNRYMSEAYSRTAKANMQGTVMHRHILGVYNLYERLIQKHPDILFESCASGGARFDPGMLYYAPQTWCSDDTDAAERLKIQYGTSLVYPVRSMGAHVSAVPNHQVNRMTSIDMRASVAFFGAFGYELDLNTLSEEELNRVKEQIEFYKKNRRLFQFGTFTRILSPFEGNTTCWMVSNEDATQVIAAYYQVLNVANGPWLKVKLAGLKPDTLYQVSYEDKQYVMYGSEIMQIGIPVDRKEFTKKGDFTSILFILQAKKGEA